MYNLFPWIHILPNTSSVLHDDEDDNQNEYYNYVYYDEEKQDNRSISLLVQSGWDVSVSSISTNSDNNKYNTMDASTRTSSDPPIFMLYPSNPARRNETELSNVINYTVSGQGVWNRYFEPINPWFLHNFNVNQSSCKDISKVQHFQQHMSSTLKMSTEPPYLVKMNEILISPGLELFCPWSVRSWRYDNVPPQLWSWTYNNSRNLGADDSNGNKTVVNRFVSLNRWYEVMRTKAHEIFQKYYRFRPYLVARADQVNPSTPKTTSSNNYQYNALSTSSCLGVHIRNNNKDGKYRSKIKAAIFGTYMDAYLRNGGSVIYLATDSRKTYQYIHKNFPSRLLHILRSQGKHVVRSANDYPLYVLDNHHRVNAEVLVDILAMSRCDILVHGYSTTSEAAIYINPVLRNNSFNLEVLVDASLDERNQALQYFEQVVQKLTSTNPHLNNRNDNNVNNNTTIQTNYYELFEKELTQTATKMKEMASLSSVSSSTQKEPSIEIKNKYVGRTTESGKIMTQRQFMQPRIVSTHHKCQNTNAIVYLAQKQHSTYDRDSFGHLLKSLDLLNKNYLSIHDHHWNNADLLIFHTGDFHDPSYLRMIQEHMTQSATHAAVVIRLIDISNTSYWARPESNLQDDPNSWYAYPLFSEGYRRMMHWFAIDIWNYFLNTTDNALLPLASEQQERCSYRYILRLDEDSYIHSPIRYNIFDYMRANNYVYGFRMCSYEMKVTQRMMTLWKRKYPSFVPKRQIHLDMCGFYNNFFVADLNFFVSAPVQDFLRFIDRQGHIYRRRLGDLMIHTMAVYWFADTNQIHRFLDFTYEHGTVSNKDHQGQSSSSKTNNNPSVPPGCLIWGGIQAGYSDPNATKTLQTYYEQMIESHQPCHVNRTTLLQHDLSPSYQHFLHHRDVNELSSHRNPPLPTTTISLETITAGRVELTHKGIKSG